MKCKNKDCVLHTAVVHSGSCVTSGATRCQDSLHNKECHTKEDIILLRSILDNHIGVYEKEIVEQEKNALPISV